jgi:hypothetical protein
MFYMHICIKREREGGREGEGERDSERERNLWGEESTWYNFLCAEVDVIHTDTETETYREREREKVIGRREHVVHSELH